MRRAVAISLLVAGLALPEESRADEGMWPYNMVPRALDVPWLDKAMKASVRFGTHASGSFVSPGGLVLTNHHVGSECIQALGAEKGSADLMKDGFLAKTREEERRCPDVELDSLRSIEDVTREVDAAAPADKSEQVKNDARRGEIAKLEKTCAHQTGLRCEVVTLFGGGAYHLYRYKKYTDVRLVFAPELGVAFFGGDRDNFTYPRFNLDFALFRAYENDAPAKIDDYLRVSKTGAEEGATIYVSGHPKATDRFAPVSKLELLRQVAFPFLIERWTAEREALRAFSERGEKQAKAAKDELLTTENAIKAYSGYLGGLGDKELMDQARKQEVHLIASVRELKDPKQRDYLLEAWPKLESAYQHYGELYRESAALERTLAPASHLSRFARTLLRGAQEREKKNEVRLEEYRDSNLESLESSLFSTPPIDPELEIELLAIGLDNIVAALGANHPVVKAMLDGETTRARAKRAVEGSKLGDVELRRRLWRGGQKAIDAAKDPMIELVAAYDGRAREIRKRVADEVESVERSYFGRIAEAHTAVFGNAVYPDATFTLRFNAGKVAGYQADGKPIAWRTTLGGMFAKYDEAKGRSPYELPERWSSARANLDLDTPFDFVTTNDIIGGSSGSPMMAADGKIVGLIFDSNLEQLPNRFVYRETSARAVGLHSRAILYALSKIYDADGLTQELTR